MQRGKHATLALSQLREGSLVRLDEHVDAQLCERRGGLVAS